MGIWKRYKTWNHNWLILHYIVSELSVDIILKNLKNIKYIILKNTFKYVYKCKYLSNFCGYLNI